jgi:hypothetical protein
MSKRQKIVLCIEIIEFTALALFFLFNVIQEVSSGRPFAIVLFIVLLCLSLQPIVEDAKEGKGEK